MCSQLTRIYGNQLYSLAMRLKMRRRRKKKKKNSNNNVIIVLLHNWSYFIYIIVHTVTTCIHPKWEHVSRSAVTTRHYTYTRRDCQVLFVQTLSASASASVFISHVARADVLYACETSESERIIRGVERGGEGRWLIGAHNNNLQNVIQTDWNIQSLLFLAAFFFASFFIPRRRRRHRYRRRL